MLKLLILTKSLKTLVQDVCRLSDTNDKDHPENSERKENLDKAMKTIAIHQASVIDTTILEEKFLKNQ